MLGEPLAKEVNFSTSPHNAPGTVKTLTLFHQALSDGGSQKVAIVTSGSMKRR